MGRIRIWPLVLAFAAAGLLAACGGNVAVNYAPVAACADVDLDPGACPR